MKLRRCTLGFGDEPPGPPMSHPAAAAAADPNPGGRPPGRGDWIRLFAIVFVAFAAGSLLAWEVFGSEAGPAFFYPPAGVTVAAMILSRRRLWPAVVAGIFAAEMLVDILFQTPLLVSVGFALANTIEPIGGPLWCWPGAAAGRIWAGIAISPPSSWARPCSVRSRAA